VPWGGSFVLRFQPPFKSIGKRRSPSRRTIASAQRLPVRLNALFARRSKEPANASLASFASFPFLKGSANATAERDARRCGRLALLGRAIIFAPMRHREKAQAKATEQRIGFQVDDRTCANVDEFARCRCFLANQPRLQRLCTPVAPLADENFDDYYQSRNPWKTGKTLRPGTGSTAETVRMTGSILTAATKGCYTRARAHVAAAKTSGISISPILQRSRQHDSAIAQKFPSPFASPTDHPRPVLSDRLVGISRTCRARESAFLVCCTCT